MLLETSNIEFFKYWNFNQLQKCQNGTPSGNHCKQNPLCLQKNSSVFHTSRKIKNRPDRNWPWLNLSWKIGWKYFNFVFEYAINSIEKCVLKIQFYSQAIGWDFWVPWFLNQFLSGPFFWISCMIFRYYPEIHFDTHFWNKKSWKIFLDTKKNHFRRKILSWRKKWKKKQMGLKSPSQQPRQYLTPTAWEFIGIWVPWIFYFNYKNSNPFKYLIYSVFEK